MSDEELAKDLGLLSALTIGIGTMIDAGIFVLPGVATNIAGLAVIVSFAVRGLIVLMNTFSVPEPGIAMPKAGGGYYVSRALGPLSGSIANLGDRMGLTFVPTLYSIDFGQYLTMLVPMPELPFLNEAQAGVLVVGAVFVGVSYIGVREIGGAQIVIVAVLLAILVLFMVQGWLSFDVAALAGDDGIALFSYGAILPRMAFVLVSFLGYVKIAAVAEELKNPGRSLPLAVAGSVVIVIVLYVILVNIMLGVMP